MEALHRTSKVLCLTVVGWIILVIVTGAITYFRELRPALALIRSNSVTQGRIEQKCAHWNVRYSFHVEGKLLQGLSQLHDPLEYQQRHVAENIVVHYVPSNPHISSLRPPEEVLRIAKSDSLNAILFFPLLSVPVLLFGSNKLVPR